MRSEDGRSSAAETLAEERTDESEEGLFWEVAAQVAAARPPADDEVDATRQPSSLQAHSPGLPGQGEMSFTPMPMATRGFQSPVLLSPRLTHRVIDLTGRNRSYVPQPEQLSRAATPWPERASSSGGPPQRSEPRQGCSRLRKSSSAEGSSAQKASCGAPRGCPALGRRRVEVDTASRILPTPVGALQPRPLVRPGTSSRVGTGPPSPQTLRQAASSRPPAAPVTTLPAFNNACAPIGQACAPMALAQPRRPSSPLGTSLRPVPVGGGPWPAGAPAPPQQQPPLPVVKAWTPAAGELRGRPEPLLGSRGVTAVPTPVTRSARSSVATVRIPEEDALAASGNVSTIAPADEHQDESFATSEVAGSMIISNREQVALDQGVGGALLFRDSQAEPATDSESSSQHVESGLANETQLIYPPPERGCCAVMLQPPQCPPPRPLAAGTHGGGPVAVYYGREPPAQVSAGTTASTSTGRSESEAASEFSALEIWCRSMGLSEAVLQRLRDEFVQCPDHLIHLDREDIRDLTEGLRKGDKISFIHAVQQLKDGAAGRAGLPFERQLLGAER